MTRHIDYSAVAALYDAMRTETVDGTSVSDIVGGGAPMPLGIHFMDILLGEAGLLATDRVLDIGCGCGRLAAALLLHLGPRASYIGVDIVSGLVDFANRHITPRHANFRFVTLDVANPAYDALRRDGASPAIASIAQAAEPGTVDVCIATSLFTHLDTEMARATLAAMRGAMAPDGRALISLFLLDDGVRALIARGAAVFQFAHAQGDGTFADDLAAPLNALAYEFDHFVRLLTEHGLYIERTLYGRWPGRPHHVSGQDIVIVRRLPDG